MIISIRDDNILLQTQAKTVRRIELALAWSKLPELASDLHRADLVGARHNGTHIRDDRLRHNSVQGVGRN